MLEVKGIDFGETKKFFDCGTHRIISPTETIEKIKELIPKVGITRVADLTGLDRLGIPVFSATVPDDRCGISINNGKGTTMEGAEAGALMETIERYSAETIDLEVITDTFKNLSKNKKVMDPYLVSSYIDLNKNLHEEIIDWIPSVEIFSGEEIFVPASLVVIPWNGNGRNIWIESTNGLGSGNIIEEAICHALNEVIERDAHTLAVLEAVIKPNLGNIIENKPKNVADVDAFDLIDIDTIPEKLREIAKNIENSGVKLLVRDITSDIKIPTFSATLVEESWEGKYYCHEGAGTHPNAEIALERAITEAAQSRLTDFQGTREDMDEQSPSEKPNEFSFLTSDGGKTKSFLECISFRNRTIEEDIYCQLKALKQINREKVFLVNLTNKELDVPVVRVIVPKLEMWVLNQFDIKGCVVDERGKKVLGLKE